MVLPVRPDPGDRSPMSQRSADAQLFTSLYPGQLAEVVQEAARAMGQARREMLEAAAAGLSVVDTVEVRFGDFVIPVTAQDPLSAPKAPPAGLQ